MDTHEGCFEEVAAHEDLVGGREGAELGGAAADLGHAVEAGGEDDYDGACNGLHHDGPAAALETVEAEDNELAERGLEEEGHRHPNLRRQHREQQLDHLLLTRSRKK